MSEPGWYHAEGDAPDTVRYWDGQTWQGEPTAAAGSGGVLYYAAPDAQIDLGDVATRTTLAEQATDSISDASYAVSPYSVSKSSVNVKRKRRFPEGLKNLTILVGILKGIPVALIIFSLLSLLRDAALTDSSLRRYGVPGVDFEGSLSTVVFLFSVIALIAAVVIVSLVRAAIKDQAGTLFATSLLMTGFDLFVGGTQWFEFSNGQPVTGALYVTLAAILQGCVTVWAGFLSNRQ